MKDHFASLSVFLLIFQCHDLLVSSWHPIASSSSKGCLAKHTAVLVATLHSYKYTHLTTTRQRYSTVRLFADSENTRENGSGEWSDWINDAYAEDEYVYDDDEDVPEEVKGTDTVHSNAPTITSITIPTTASQPSDTPNKVYTSTNLMTEMLRFSSTSTAGSTVLDLLEQAEENKSRQRPPPSKSPLVITRSSPFTPSSSYIPPVVSDAKNKFQDTPSRRAGFDFEGWSEEPPYFDDDDIEDYDHKEPSKQLPIPPVPSKDLITAGSSSKEQLAISTQSLQSIEARLSRIESLLESMQTLNKRNIKKTSFFHKSNNNVLIQFVFMSMFLTFQFILVKKL